MAELRVALGDYPHTAPLKDGRVGVDGHELSFVELGGPITRAFRAMARELCYDVCELGISTAVMAIEHGLPLSILPVFPTRQFDHATIHVSVASGVDAPEDLEGRRVGSRGYTIAGGVWARGILSDGYGVDLDSIEWLCDDEEHLPGTQVPANVAYEPGANLGEAMERGELDAGIGVYRGNSRAVRPLFSDPLAAMAEFHTRSGLYPIHHTVVARNDVLGAHPGLFEGLVAAFAAAKEEAAPAIASDPGLSRLADVVGGDPLPYGLEANRRSLEALLRYGDEQHFLARTHRLEDLFAAP